MRRVAIALLIGLLAAGAASAGVALAASNTVSASPAGEGIGPISGYTVSAVHYLPAADPSRLSAVEFDLDQPAGTVLVRLVASATDYTACLRTSGNHWRCNLTVPLPLVELDELRVIAIQE